MKVALAQFNPVVGDLAGNVRRHGECIDAAARAGADLVVFGELSVVGYPPRDLLAKQGFAADCRRAVEALAARCTDIAALVGFVQPTAGPAGRRLQNVAAVLAGGSIAQVHVKSLLPTYDVFDETRYFEPGRDVELLDIAGRQVGLSICEDLWDASSLGWELYDDDPIHRLVSAGAEVIVNMAASPYEQTKPARREELFRRRARELVRPIVYVNQVGGNDELIFDGGSCVVSPAGEVVARAKSFAEDLLVADLDEPGPARVETPPDRMAGLAEALQLGLGDYVHKCGFSRVVLGLSGGIDSAIVAVLAADALGARNVTALAMPSRYSSDHSLADAFALANNLGIACHEVPIEPIHSAFEQVLAEALTHDAPGRDVAEENVQARIRGNLVMAWSNAYGQLALATGNKSELACGYCTLYGDMAGGIAPIGDVLKTEVYELARYINDRAGAERIPENILAKPPSAELKPGQVDQDKLPPYDVLDGILQMYVTEDQPADAIIAAGFDATLVGRILRLVDLSEYKRQQAARVLKVSGRAFGMGRRMPIAQRYIQRTDRP